MTILLRMKLEIKLFFGKYETFFLALARFAAAFLYFRWINQNMGFLARLSQPLVPLLAAAVCCLLPPVMTVTVGFLLILMHSYAIGIEAAGFTLVLILLIVIFFLRFSAGTSIVLALTPVSFSFGIPVLLPMASGLITSAASAIPATCGVMVYYFIRFLSGQYAYLSSPEVEPIDKLKVMSDGIVLNWGMWITMVAFVLVILLVNLIRTRSFDYSWHVAIVFGGFVYIVAMLTGSNYLSATVDTTYLVGSTAVAAVICLILEFFFNGGDYKRTERLQFEDDDYFYYVKAVPKYAVPVTKRSIKKINAEPAAETHRQEVEEVPYANPIFNGDQAAQENDLEKKLEESLRDL